MVLVTQEHSYRVVRLSYEICGRKFLGFSAVV